MKKITVIIVLCIIGIFLSTSLFGQSTATTFYNNGVAFSQKKNYSLAIGEFTKAIEADRGFTSAYYNRGTAYKELGNFELAVADLTTAIHLDPQSAADAYINRGVAYFRLNEIDRAIADYTKVISLNPKRSGAYYNLGIAYYRQGNIDQSIEAYTRAIETDPQHTNAYYNRGLAYFQNGEYPKSLEDFNQVIKLNPQHPNVASNISEVQVVLEAEAERRTQYINSILAQDYPIHYFLYNFETAKNFIDKPSDFIRRLVQEGHNERVKDEQGNTPLIIAVQKNIPTSILNFLLAIGADRDLNSKQSADSNGNLALHYAVQNRNHEIIRILLSEGARVDIENNNGRTAMNLAIIYDETGETSRVLEEATKNQ